ncbi:MAG: hypothetical protein ACI9J3_002734 [Parvicellaceae bacterium]|jgi:hypothetical protein
MKVAFLAVLILISSTLFSQADSVKSSLPDFPIKKQKCGKEEITSVRTNRRGTKTITKGMCYGVVGYYTYMDPPPPKYGNGIKFRRVERILK